MSPEASRHASIAGSLDTVPRRDPWGHPKQIDVMQCLTQCINCRNVAEKAGRYWKIHSPMTSTKICLQSSSLCQDFHQIPWLSDVSENVWVWSWLIDNIEPKQPKQLKLAETALKLAKICQVSGHRSKGDEISELGLLSWNSRCLTWINNNKHVNGKEKWSKVVQSGLQKSWSDSFTKLKLLKLLRFRCFNSTCVTEQLGPERRRFHGTHLCRCNTLASVLSYGMAKSMIINNQCNSYIIKSSSSHQIIMIHHHTISYIHINHIHPTVLQVSDETNRLHLHCTAARPVRHDRLVAMPWLRCSLQCG